MMMYTGPNAIKHERQTLVLMLKKALMTRTRKTRVVALTTTTTTRMTAASADAPVAHGSASPVGSASLTRASLVPSSSLALDVDGSSRRPICSSAHALLPPSSSSLIAGSPIPTTATTRIWSDGSITKARVKAKVFATCSVSFSAQHCECPFLLIHLFHN